MKQLEQNVIKWAQERGIFEKATPLTQHDKTIEEVIEIRDGLVRLEFNRFKADYFQQAMDGIGDTIVTLIILAKMLGTDIETCLQMAWDEIKDRKGKMIDGKFVKEGGFNE
jgi:NTP pyrophosphatase (non-canonical NTP hydrolase)